MTIRKITRYKNRKLYDTVSGSYVSLGELAALIRNGETVEVTDRSTGEDITPSTLVQIILEEGKKGDHILPTDLLHEVVRTSSKTVEGAVHTVHRHLDTLLNSSLGRLKGWLEPDSHQSDLGKLRNELSRLEEMLGRLLTRENKNKTPQ